MDYRSQAYEKTRTLNNDWLKNGEDVPEDEDPFIAEPKWAKRKEPPLNPLMELHTTTCIHMFNRRTLKPSQRLLAQCLLYLLNNCEENSDINILSVSLSSMSDQLEQFESAIKQAINKNCTIRIALANPDSTFSSIHPDPAQLKHRVYTMLDLLNKVKFEPNAGDKLLVWTVDFPFHCSTYRVGVSTLVVPHLFKQPSSDAPVFALTERDQLSEIYAEQFNQIIKSDLALSINK